MFYKSLLIKLVLVALSLPSLSNAGQSFGFFEGPNAYTYTRDGLKSHIESATSRVSNEFNPEICSRLEHKELMEKLRKYQPSVDRIKQSVLSGSYKNTTYEGLVDFLDTFGHRVSGSVALEKSIDYLQDAFESSPGVDIAWTEPVNVPKWERGEESALLVTSANRSLAMFSLGQSVPTPPNGIIADVVVFDNYKSLAENIANVRDKIVVCNFIGVEGDILDTKNTGYPQVADNGGLAILYKSAATFSLYTPHTRRANLYYNGVSKEIPIAYLTIEDTALLSRIYARGEQITLHLKIFNKYHNDVTESRNLFGDWMGSALPEEHLILSAHTDSWDVGQGAQDDAIGIYLVLQTMNLLSELSLRPRRTIRSALWTAEEYGFNGSATYIKEYYRTAEQIEKLTLAMEADYACLANAGFIFHANYQGNPLRPHNLMTHEELGCIMTSINEMLGSDVTLGLVYESDSYGTDLDRFIDLDVPVVSLLGDDGRYFWYHHTDSDTVSALNPLQLDYCLASWASATYILADLEYSTENRGGSASLTYNFVTFMSLSLVHLLTM